MTINPAIPTTTPAMQTGGSPLANEAGKGNGANGVNQGKGADFSQKLQATAPPKSPDAATAANATSKVGQTNNVQTTQRVNTDNAVPDKQDMFGHFDKVRKDLDSYLQKSHEVDTMVSEGKLKPDDPKVVQQHREEMRMLLHFQSEMQDSAFKVQIASQVVEHGTSGVKTVLQTQT